MRRTAKERPVRLSASAPRVGDPVRIGVSGVEIEAQIVDASGPVLRVKVKAAALRAKSRKCAKTA
jgi:hypothetical protein